MYAEPYRFKVSQRGLRILARGLDRPPDSAPDVGFVRHVDWNDEVICGLARARSQVQRTISGITFACPGNARCDSWITIGAIVPHRGAGLLKLSLRGFEALVRDIDLLFQRVELRILIDFPPFSAQRLICRLCWFPVLRRLLVIRWHRCGGARIARAHDTTAHQQQTGEECP